MKLERVFEFLEDDNHRFSSTRLIFLIWSIVMIIGWMIISIGQQKFVEIPNNAMWILLSLMTGKVIQKFGESKGEKPPKEVKPPNNIDTKAA